MALSQTHGRLAGKVVVVTGCARGIGQAVAVRFAEEGARLVLLDIADMSETNGLVAKASSPGVIHLSFIVDISNEPVVFKLAATLSEEFVAGVHGIVASHAIFIFKSVEKATPEDWMKSYQVNVVGSAILIKAFLPALKLARSSSIVLLGSISSFL